MASQPSPGAPHDAVPQPAQQSASDSQGITSRARTRRLERSCALCHRRKVRCDKKMPCSTCTRTGVLCCYPSSAPVAPRKERSTISDIADRLAQLERTIVAISSSDGASGAGDASEPGPAPAEEHAAVESPNMAGDSLGASPETPGMLVNRSEGYPGHYVNEALLSRVLEEEEQEIQSIMGTPSFESADTPDTAVPGTGPPSFGFLALMSQLPPGSGSRRQTKLHPLKWQAIRLWQAFVHNVDAIFKVLHIPTVQVKIYAAINDLESAPPDIECLMFATYFAGTTSLSTDEVIALFGEDKMTCLTRFSAGLDACFGAANVLERPTLTALQAMTIYLQTMRAYNRGRAVWVANGIMLRLAYSMGLHRDPSRLGVSTFEAEMRRRLWWHITNNDARSVEDHGLAVNLFEPSTDTRMPLAIDDRVLHPDMTELPPAPTDRFTDMTLATIIYETTRTSQQLLQMAPGLDSVDAATRPSEAVREEIMQKLHTHVQARLACCDPVIPQQRAVLCIINAMVRKFDFVSRQQWQRRTTSARLSEASLTEASEILEMQVAMATDELLRNYRWGTQLYPPYHLLLHVLCHLGTQPAGPVEDRAWKAVDALFALEETRHREGSLSPLGVGSKWEVLKALRRKALQLRSGGKPVAAVGEAMPSLQEVAVDADIMDWGAPFDSKMGFVWDTGYVDWDRLVEDLTAGQPYISEPG